MLFTDYSDTKRLYHIVCISDLKYIFEDGLRFSKRLSYKDKYQSFHEFMDIYRTENVPEWVVRKRALFASLNYKDNQIWHSHSAILSIKVDTDCCWVANENTANFLYEPFVLKTIHQFASLNDFLYNKGKEIAEDYWLNSMCLMDYLGKRKSVGDKYDAEVLIMKDIKPADINLIAIVTDHRIIPMDAFYQTYR